ncbi:hypothetical protein RHRU231_30030 [Rhodococcus ruber]|uniref:Uncharacterized protein n=1 Tax=Rhodococcus ruber TaxID=1830 RepID=A0A098BH27_9NOCA|nr:hypothetical protein RHRU231_30030 [Rhodococcus ruber]
MAKHILNKLERKAKNYAILGSGWR